MSESDYKLSDAVRDLERGKVRMARRYGQARVNLEKAVRFIVEQGAK